ncbi:LOW QUALITY PROTEIN: hypothetical protein KUTeg_017030 [Tegillarca granosa]|uniref:C-type lectin domain-containing protein n=1 Tax=Tegillarca granosa TaxID=220873 RepID=A0ABQ9EMT3_TEGGR|nr:LOW QUALITY PROTEIN: hypothetical protein KUTeg_017030 [Tegillarca granosa]
MDPSEITNIAMLWRPPGKNGRLKETWRKSFEKEIKELGSTWGQTQRLATDRMKWKSSLKVLCALRHKEEMTFYLGLTQEGCDEGWTFYSQSCYQFIPQEYDFDAAKGICMAKGAYLASVWEDDEYKFIQTTFGTIIIVVVVKRHKHFCFTVENALLSIQRNKMAWLGLYHRPDRIKGFMWVDGSNHDQKPQETPEDKFNCGALTENALDMTYIVSDAFNTTHPQGVFSAEPERLLFERVWPPKLQTVPQYVSMITTTQVAHETDCAYKCFHVDYCRAFTLRCLLYTKCNSFSCDLFSPRYVTET